MVIDQYAEYVMSVSKLTVVKVGHEDMIKAYKFDLRVKGQHRIVNMNVHVTSSHMCQICKPVSNQKIVMSRTKKHVKNPINLTLRSKFKVVSGS